MSDGSLDFAHFVPTARERAIAKLSAAVEPDRKLDETVARALGYRIAATTHGPHIMRPSGIASWDLPHYTATPESRARAIMVLISTKADNE